MYMAQIELIDNGPRLAEVAARLSALPRVAVDIESNGFFRYRERVCLVQLASCDAAFVIDPLAIDDLLPLGELLADRSVEKLFHAAGNDVRSLHRDWGYQVGNLFDTSIAASFVGSTQLGMQAVLKEHAGLDLAKPRNLQRSDWTLRPLSEDALTYAADDVLHLDAVREALVEQLMKLSRLQWVLEECRRLEDVRYAPAEQDLAFLAVKGSRHLDGRGLSILRTLYEFRDREALLADRPFFKVIPDAALVQLASEPASDLATVKGLGRFARPPGNRTLKEAINRGLDSEPPRRPDRVQVGEPLTAEERKEADVRLSSLKTWRSQLGEELGLNPGLLWPAASLERLAKHPETLEAESGSAEVRGWQELEFGGSLERVLSTLY
jgi:ribonuclease D